MKKKQLMLGCMAVLGACMLAACSGTESTGNSGSVSGESKTTQESFGGDRETEEEQEVSSPSGKYEGYWFATLTPTNGEAAPYPFTRLGTMDGYLPGMLPEELVTDGFSHFFPREHSSGWVNVKPSSYEELKVLTDIETIGVYYDTLDWEGNQVKKELVEYLIELPEEGAEGYTVEQAFADGNYEVRVGNSNADIDGTYVGLTADVRRTELAETIIEEWGMPSCIWLPWGAREGDYIFAYLCYEYSDYVAAVETMGDDDGSVIVMEIDVIASDIDELFRELGESGGATAVKWEP